MCVTSAVSDYYTKDWPQRFPLNPTPWVADPETARLLREVVERLDKLDRRLGDIECKDATKAAFLKAIAEAATPKTA